MKSHQRSPNAKWRNCEPEKTRVARWHQVNCRVLENLGGQAHARRSYAVFDARCQICVQCRGVVRYPVSVGKHTVLFDDAHVRRRELYEGMVVLVGGGPNKRVVFTIFVDRKDAQITEVAQNF